MHFVESAEMHAYSFRGRKFEAVGVGPIRQFVARRTSSFINFVPSLYFTVTKTTRLPFYRRQTTREGIFAPVTLTLAR